MRVKFVAPILFGSALAIACGGSDKTSHFGDGTGAGSSGTGGGGGTIVVGSGGSSSGAGTGDSGAGSLDPDAACATSSADGQPVPVDLLFMVDITGSMDCPVPDDPANPCTVQPNMPYSSTTRWTVESAALNAFVSDPANSGLGMGITFFPNSKTLCSANSYTTPNVEIGALPGAAKALDAAIGMQVPGGNTPTTDSLQGALDHAATWAQANPTHKVAVVYSTDGYPNGCSNDTIAGAAQVAATAFAATPSIPTYVLGVGSNLTDLNMIAASGGTTQAFLIDTTGNAATELSAALATIRTTAVVGCTYTIPPPPAGQTLDPSKVNVTYTDPSGKVTSVLQDAPGTTCDQGTGWEYSADGKQINLCGSLCTSIKSNPGGSVQVLFGCATMIGPPPK
jgi:hypothetical protein